MNNDTYTSTLGKVCCRSRAGTRKARRSLRASSPSKKRQQGYEMHESQFDRVALLRLYDGISTETIGPAPAPGALVLIY